MGLAEDLRARMIEWDHSRRNKTKKTFKPGLSGVGDCRAMRILNYHLKPEFKFSGQAFRGIWFEIAMREVFPVGSVINENYRIHALDVPVEVRIGDFDFESQIDAIVYNTTTNEKELWDWKSTYLSNVLDEGKDTNIMQVNLLAYFCDISTFRLIYADATDWHKFAIQSYETDPNLGREAMGRAINVEFYKKEPLENIPKEFFEGYKMVRLTPKLKNEKRPCDWCSVRKDCEKLLGCSIDEKIAEESK